MYSPVWTHSSPSLSVWSELPRRMSSHQWLQPWERFVLRPERTSALRPRRRSSSWSRRRSPKAEMVGLRQSDIEALLTRRNFQQRHWQGRFRISTDRPRVDSTDSRVRSRFSSRCSLTRQNLLGSSNAAYHDGQHCHSNDHGGSSLYVP